MRIPIEYLNPVGKCWKKTKWGGCCCSCINHLLVYKHCCHSPRKKDCVCSESLKFYVCIGFIHFKEYKANLIGKHGFCELYEEVKTGTKHKIKEN